MLIDLHVHSWLSVGCELDPKNVVEKAALHGLDGVAFTETNTLDGCDELLELGAKAKIRVFVGLELVTDKGQYLCFFPNPENVPEPVQLWGSNREKAWSADECLPKMKSLGAVIVAARPYDREGPSFAGDYVLSQKNLLSAVETYNPKVRQTANDLAAEAAQQLKVPCIAGSDAKSSADELGRAATLFKEPVKTQADLVKALESGTYWPVMMAELPRLTKPGEAREVEQRRAKKKRRMRRPGPWGGGGG